MIHVISLDHLVLTVKSIEATAAFYSQLGFKRENFGDGRVALRFGQQKINLHQQGREIAPNARIPVPGSADLCFLVRTPPHELIRELESQGIQIELGPVERTGATSKLISIYFRDPDENLIELSNPQAELSD